VSNNQEVTLAVPPGAVQEDVSLTYLPLPLPAVSPTAGQALLIPVASFSLTAERNDGTFVTQFVHPLIITVKFDPSGLTPDQVDRLAIYFFRDSTRQWESLPTVIDVSRSTATATVDHFTLFALFEAVPPEATPPAPPREGRLYLPLLSREGPSGW
jgi:hypothetical protein